MAILISIAISFVMNLILSDVGVPYFITLVLFLSVTSLFTLAVGIHDLVLDQLKDFDSSSVPYQVFVSSFSSALFGATFPKFSEITDADALNTYSLSLLGFLIVSLLTAMSLTDTLYSKSKFSRQDRKVSGVVVWGRIITWIPVFLLVVLLPSVVLYTLT